MVSLVLHLCWLFRWNVYILLLLLNEDPSWALSSDIIKREMILLQLAHTIIRYYSILYDIYIFMIYVSAYSIYKQKQTCSENLYQPSSKRFKFRPKALPPTLADGRASHPHGYQSAWHSAAHVGRALPRRNLWQSRGCPWRMEVVLKPKYEIHRNSIWIWWHTESMYIYIYIHIVYRCIL